MNVLICFKIPVQCIRITNRQLAVLFYFSSYSTADLTQLINETTSKCGYYTIDPFFIHHTQMHGDNVKLLKANLFIKPHHYDSDHMVTKAR